MLAGEAGAVSKADMDELLASVGAELVQIKAAAAAELTSAVGS